MKIDEQTVRSVAKLASLEITEAEVAKFSQELSAILDYVDLLNQADFSPIEGYDRAQDAVVIAGTDTLREDAALTPYSREQLLANRATMTDGFEGIEDGAFVVPRILEN
ncbi:MAG: Asp-tRNA(Asn)/Glu-tRNA(Gln) amidotransferase subunit GatC [Vampirovibrionales bacterium]|nr:Asp-tRNA(Asn)/Glu-tRNA(Gln) amidotransferase subunit GatC [Vampirovibrionales bacterium]